MLCYYVFMKVGEFMNREDFIKQEIKKQGYTLKDFSAKINMPYTTLLSIVNKSIGGASLDNIIKICTGLKLNIECLNPYNTDTLNDEHLRQYNKLNALGQQKVNEYIMDLLEIPKFTVKKKADVPLSDFDAATDVTNIISKITKNKNQTL